MAMVLYLCIYVDGRIRLLVDKDKESLLRVSVKESNIMSMYLHLQNYSSDRCFFALQ